MNLKHAVVTSVDRDDLQDGGAEHWALTIRAIRHTCASTTLEVLIPDFRGDLALIDKLIDEGPHIVGHNLETVRRLTPAVRSLAGYDRSLKVIAHAARRVPCKTGIMVGLGETEAEVLEVMDDALRAGARMLTIGQYLPPSQKMLPVSEYVSPEKFRAWKEIALGKGYRSVESAPLVRSSYHAKAKEVDE
jgi:lipoic acid synthetase